MTIQNAQSFTLEATPIANVISGGQITFSYPLNYTGQDFTDAVTSLVIGINIFPAKDEYTVKLGDTSATVTLTNGLTCPAFTSVKLGVTYLPQPLDAGQPLRNIKAVILDASASFTLDTPHKGAYVHVSSVNPVAVSLPNDWRRGDSAIIRRVGAGVVTWNALTGSTVVLPASKTGHVGIGEQHAEILLRVISNADGVHASWAIAGTTA